MASTIFIVAALALSPVIGGGFGEMTNAILQILVFSAVVFHIAASAKTENAMVRVPGMVALGLFGAAFVASVTRSEALYFSLKQLLFVAACVGAFAVTAAVCRDARAAAAVVWAVVVSAMLVCVFGIRGYAISAGGGAQFWKALLAPADHWRLFGPFVNPGFFAGYLVIALPITLCAYLVARRWSLAALAGLGFVVQTLALLLTGAKFGIICAVAGLLVFFLLAAGTGALKRARFTRLLVIAVVLLPLTFLFSKPVISRISAAEAGGSQVHSTEFRIFTWQATWHMITARPWLGVGPGVYEIAYPRYTIAGPTKNAHESYLQIAAESGLPALAFLILALSTILWRSLRAVARSSGSASAPPTKTSDEPVSAAVSWRDLVPFSARRVVACSLFGALTGSVMRSLVDSDWYVLGIALPFSILAGMLVSQSGAGQLSYSLSSRWRFVAGLTCGLLILLSVSFGLGDYYANGARDQQKEPGADAESIRLEELHKAVRVCPLNPRYHREYGKLLAYTLGADEPQEGIRHIDRAIQLAPTDAANYQARGLVALWTGDPDSAIRYLQKSLSFNPNSTHTLMLLADTFAGLGDNASRESILQELLDIETSSYEQIKGTPEVVDTTFAYAHVYFGEKNLEEGNLSRAVGHFDSAAERLERWRSNERFLEVARYMGSLSPEEERGLLMLLRDCYYRIAEIREETGNREGARIALSKARKIKIPDY